tara:strand:+ start:641 stop:892 length:252 start_codon:yes stop_codon:yes gene_type:complete
MKDWIKNLESSNAGVKTRRAIVVIPLDDKELPLYDEVSVYSNLSKMCRSLKWTEGNRVYLNKKLKSNNNTYQYRNMMVIKTEI